MLPEIRLSGTESQEKKMKYPKTEGLWPVSRVGAREVKVTLWFCPKRYKRCFMARLKRVMVPLVWICKQLQIKRSQIASQTKYWIRFGIFFRPLFFFHLTFVPLRSRLCHWLLCPHVLQKMLNISCHSDFWSALTVTFIQNASSREASDCRMSA